MRFISVGNVFTQGMETNKTQYSNATCGNEATFMFFTAISGPV